MIVANPSAQAVRASIDHPVIDSDGHFNEFFPVMCEYLVAEGGQDLLQAFFAALRKTYVSSDWYDMSVEQRRDVWQNRPVFWASAGENTLDFATAMLPGLLYRRMDEIGLDFSVMYPGLGLVALTFADADVRRATVRALNRYYADVFRDLSDRMTPAALIPMHTPEEALAELNYVVGTLGFKVVLFPSFVRRPIGAAVRQYPDAARYAFRLDTFGIDSEHDYDPVWRKCVDLGVLPTFHGASEGIGPRTSPSNYCYNHIGHFAAAGDALAKSLFLGGVPNRFPELKFLFLEGGVGWARSLLADTIGHWEKRNKDAIGQYDTANLDRALFRELYRQYAGPLFREEIIENFDTVFVPPQDPGEIDDFSLCGIERKADFLKRFVEPFYFGCEADDPVTSSAFDARRNPLGARLNAVMGSDIGHWDVPDMRGVLEEAYEPVGKGQITGQDFRDFVFTNPVRLWTTLNPLFFKGTRVEDAVRAVLEPA